MPSTLAELLVELRQAADPDRARSLAGFFKTGKGSYGEDDQFLGIRVPVQRKIARRFLLTSLVDIETLLSSTLHEHRFVAAEILVAQYERAKAREASAIYHFYLRNSQRFNNWDLVDTSAPYIVGAHLLTRSRAVLKKLARSKNLWERRIAIISTLAFIRSREIDETFEIAKLLLHDEHDLIHKAVGWMLREAGKVSRPRLLAFLEANYAKLPRTTLRYAIEHLDAPHRKRILAGDFALGDAQRA